MKPRNGKGRRGRGDRNGEKGYKKGINLFYLPVRHQVPQLVYIYISSAADTNHQIQEVVSWNPGDTGQTVGFSFE